MKKKKTHFLLGFLLYTHLNCSSSNYKLICILTVLLNLNQVCSTAFVVHLFDNYCYTFVHFCQGILLLNSNFISRDIDMLFTYTASTISFIIKLSPINEREVHLILFLSTKCTWTQAVLLLVPLHLTQRPNSGACAIMFNVLKAFLCVGCLINLLLIFTKSCWLIKSAGCFIKCI